MSSQLGHYQICSQNLHFFTQEVPVPYAKDSLESGSPGLCFPFPSLELLLHYEQCAAVPLRDEEVAGTWFVSEDCKFWDLAQAVGIRRD